MIKICSGCKTPKDKSEFYLNSGRKDGLAVYCKPCFNRKQRASYIRYKERVFDKLGRKCVHCGFLDTRALQIDHVNGGGVKEHFEVRSSNEYLRRVLDDDTGKYQLLCANCNWIKRHECGEQPGKTPQYRPAKPRKEKKPWKHSDQSRAEMGKAISEAWKDPEKRARWIQAAKDSSANRRISDEDLIAEYNKTLSPKTTARALGIVYSAVHKRISKLGLMVSRAERIKNSGLDILQLHNTGKTNIEIAAQLGLHRCTVARRLEIARQALAA